MDMQLDRKSVDQMLRMDDKQLRRFIAQLAAEAGIDISALKIGAGDLAALRATLGSASNQDLARLAAQIAAQQKGGNHGK